MMKQQNYRGDFSIVETFFRTVAGDASPITVPDHIRIEYFTDPHGEVFVVERNGSTFQNCKLSADGMSLTSELALSRHCIGCGVLYKVITEIIPDPAYPDGAKMIPYPSKTEIVLIQGPSDNTDLVIESEALLAGFKYGYSAYELAVQNGFEGSVDEWLDSLKMSKEDLTPEDREDLLEGTTAVRSSTVRTIETELSSEKVQEMIDNGTYDPQTLYLCR